MSEIVVDHLSAAAQAVVADIARDRLGAVRAFQQLWALIALERQAHGDYLASTGRVGDVFYQMHHGMSVEQAIRSLLEEHHQVSLLGISDVEMMSDAPAFGGRLRAYELAKLHGAASVERLTDRIARGGRSLDEIIWCEAAAAAADGERPAVAEVISLASRRRRA